MWMDQEPRVLSDPTVGCRNQNFECLGGGKPKIEQNSIWTFDGTVQYDTVRYGTVPVQYGTAQYGTERYGAEQYGTELKNSKPEVRECMAGHSTVRYGTLRYGTEKKQARGSRMHGRAQYGKVRRS